MQLMGTDDNNFVSELNFVNYFVQHLPQEPKVFELAIELFMACAEGSKQSRPKGSAVEVPSSSDSKPLSTSLASSVKSVSESNYTATPMNSRSIQESDRTQSSSSRKNRCSTSTQITQVQEQSRPHRSEPPTESSQIPKRSSRVAESTQIVQTQSTSQSDTPAEERSSRGRLFTRAESSCEWCPWEGGCSTLFEGNSALALEVPTLTAHS